MFQGTVALSGFICWSHYICFFPKLSSTIILLFCNFVSKLIRDIQILFSKLGKTKFTRLKVMAIIKLPSRYKLCKVYSLYLYLTDGVHTELKTTITNKQIKRLRVLKIGPVWCVYLYIIFLNINCTLWFVWKKEIGCFRTRNHLLNFTSLAIKQHIEWKQLTGTLGGNNNHFRKKHTL